MIDSLRDWSASNRDPVDAYLRRCFGDGRALLLQSDLCAMFEAQAKESGVRLAGTPFERAVQHFQKETPWNI